VQYNVYFAPEEGDPLLVIYSTTTISNNTFSYVYDYNGVPSVAGCYAVTAVDSFGNESPMTVISCVDNCPEYELPNIFTPNGDGVNDLFTPLPGYRYVKDVDISIYDRWGILMFHTTDPDVKWDGSSAQSKKPCPDGTYFYTCTVNEIHLSGIVPRSIKGFVQLLPVKTSPSH
jgi:gliding motility-associated-like protein